MHVFFRLSLFLLHHFFLSTLALTRSHKINYLLGMSEIGKGKKWIIIISIWV
jgi:hypothetical protein